MKKIAFLENPVQKYAWGSRTFIPDLLGESFPGAEPQAELWMGAHPRAPSTVILHGKQTSLRELIRENPIDILGKSVAGRFGNTLPFLFKVLAATKPLSIQAHPNEDKAREGFEREKRQKIPLSAPNRNYKDENHKPEIICALKPFWVLKGFRKVEEILLLLDKIGTPTLEDERNALGGQPNREGLKNFFKALITLEKGRKAQIISEVLEGCKKVTEQYPAMEWVGKLSESYPKDIGILSPILMNPVHLQEGEAINIPAGELHAYLEGAGIELMANSDNVLRGGLTPKHVDVQELLNILTFKTDKIDLLKPKQRKDGEKVYATATDEFILSVLDVHKDTLFQSPTERSVEIMICVEGTARITDLGIGEVLPLKKGSSFIVPAAVAQYQIEGPATIYKASVPL